LSDNAFEVLKHLHRLWGFTVRLETVDEQGKRELVAECPRR
jgi:spore cortex formation protein SpoVR/YcgB (stage V sporulation)